MIQRFTIYRHNVAAQGKHTELQRNPDDQAQCEGVIWSDGTVTLRWLTACKSTSVWDCLEDMLNIHGHPEYGTVIEFPDGPTPEAWTKRLAAYQANKEAAVILQTSAQLGEN